MAAASTSKSDDKKYPNDDAAFDVITYIRKHPKNCSGVFARSTDQYVIIHDNIGVKIKIGISTSILVK